MTLRSLGRERERRSEPAGRVAAALSWRNDGASERKTELRAHSIAAANNGIATPRALLAKAKRHSA